MTETCTHERLAQQKSFIFQDWSSRVQQKIKAASEQSAPALTNTLPEFIDRLIDVLNPVSESTGTSHGNSLATEHGIQRAGLMAYDLEQVIDEFAVLQETTIDSLNKSGVISANDCHLIARSFLEAARNAASSFVKAKKVCDQTERKITDNEIKEAKDAAERANSLKNTFVANMSHEIRTPLGVILGFSRILKDENLSSCEREQYASVIDRNGKMLLRLIDDILDISKIEAGKLDILNVDVPIRKSLSEVVALFQSRADEKNLSLNLSVDPKVADFIHTDPIRLRQIVSNLLSNAVKFTEKGGIRVYARPFGKGENLGLNIFVCDTGPGLAQGTRGRLFGEFSQADASVTRKHGGSGLGLALSRGLARELGGDLELRDCEENVGCTFELKIADRKPERRTEDKKENKEAPARNSARNEKTYPHLAGTRVLLVEDSVDNQLLVKLILSKAGVTVEFANNGVQGVRKASAEEFDAVLMDTQMPVMDGNHATRSLREIGYTRPIIALSAHAMLEDRIKSLRAGCNDCLTKPIEAGALLELMEKWMTEVRH